MVVTAGLTLVLALSAGAGGERVLLCRPRVEGDAALARGDAVAEAGRAAGRFLDYGVACDDAAEGARAARRVGLGHAVASVAEGRTAGSRYTLVLADAETEAERARRTLEVLPGADAAAPLRAALGDLLGTLPGPAGPSPARIAQWSLVGAGAVALAAGAALALRARSAAADANGAADPAGYTRARADWKDRRAASGVLLGLGAAAVAGGLTWRFAF